MSTRARIAVSRHESIDWYLVGFYHHAARGWGMGDKETSQGKSGKSKAENVAAESPAGKKVAPEKPNPGRATSSPGSGAGKAKRPVGHRKARGGLRPRKPPASAPSSKPPMPSEASITETVQVAHPTTVLPQPSGVRPVSGTKRLRGPPKSVVSEKVPASPSGGQPPLHPSGGPTAERPAVAGEGRDKAPADSARRQPDEVTKQAAPPSAGAADPKRSADSGKGRPEAEAASAPQEAASAGTGVATETSSPMGRYDLEHPLQPRAPSPWDSSRDFQAFSDPAESQAVSSTPVISSTELLVMPPVPIESGRRPSQVSARARARSNRGAARETESSRSQAKSTPASESTTRQQKPPPAPAQQAPEPHWAPEPGTSPPQASPEMQIRRAPIAPQPEQRQAVVPVGAETSEASSQRRSKRDGPSPRSVAAAAFAEKKPPTFLCGMGILAMLLLFLSAAVPRVDAAMHFLAPWALLGKFGGLTFHAALFFAVLLPFVIGRLPLPYIVRSVAFLGIGMTMFVFALSHMRIAISEFAFRGHSGITLFLDGPAGLLVYVMATFLFPVALYWRSRYTASFASRIAVLFGALVVLSAYFVMGAVAGGEGPPPVVALFSSLSDSGLFLADRITVGLLLVPLMLLPLALLVLLPHPRSGLAGLWAWLYVTAIGVIPLVQAGFVSHFRDGGYKYVLAPLKASLLFYAALLVVTVAMGHLIGEVGRLNVNMRNRKA